MGRSRLGSPKRRGEREMLRVLVTAREGAVHAHSQGVNQLYALVVAAPEALRQRLHSLRGEGLVKACLQLRPAGEPETALTAATLRSVARRAKALGLEAAEYEKQIRILVAKQAPCLLCQPGVGALTAAQVLLSRSHGGRLRSADAFAKPAGVAPIPASSGRVQRHRLNRLGDRQLNRASGQLGARGELGSAGGRQPLQPRHLQDLLLVQ